MKCPTSKRELDAAIKQCENFGMKPLRKSLTFSENSSLDFLKTWWPHLSDIERYYTMIKVRDDANKALGKSTPKKKSIAKKKPVAKPSRAKKLPKIKNCPCGKRGVLEHFKSAIEPWSVACVNDQCQKSPFTATYYTKKLAIDDWNKEVGKRS